MKPYSFKLAALLLPISLFTIAPAQAYTTLTCTTMDFPFDGVSTGGIVKTVKWPSNNVTMKASAVSYPPGNPRNVLTSAIDRWNENPSEFRFGITYNDTSVGFNNGENEIWYTNADIGFPAAEYERIDPFTCEKIESDIIVSGFSQSWTYSTNKTSNGAYGGTRRPHKNMLMHELGHTIGLKHTADTYSLMGLEWNVLTVNGSQTRAQIGEDAAHGAVGLYGRNSGQTIEDVSVTHWRRTGENNGYSMHERTRVLSTFGFEAPSVTVNGEPVYIVTPGQTVVVEFTYENSGETLQSFTTEFRLSTNHYISPSDTYLGEFPFSLGRNTAYTATTTLTLPNNLNSGQSYWIGSTVDSESEISEVSENNNRSYIGILVI